MSQYALYSFVLTLSLLLFSFQKEKKSVEVPRIDFIEMSAIQPHQNTPDVIWYDDFSSEKKYMESEGKIDYYENFGVKGGSMEAGFDKGDVNGNGGRKIAFGDFPAMKPWCGKANILMKSTGAFM